MAKKVVFSANLEHDVIKRVIPILKKKIRDINLVLHDPTKDFLDLEDLPRLFGDADMFIVKIGSQCSLDLLHFAKLYNIPTLHDIDTVLMCKDKVALDHALRKVFNENLADFKNISVPKSWTQNLKNFDRFKEWAKNKLPIVIKSHFQHDKYMRFNFLVKEIEELEKFCKMYSNFLYYDVYIQEFIECDGIDRKVYVIGDKIFGIKRENPIYIYLRENPESIDVDNISRDEFKVPKNLKILAKILSRELKLKIFGFDLLKSLKDDLFYLIDLNDFPGLRGIKNIDSILADFILSLF
ncbi:MAG: RimK family alpha-L-glutamate ligase [Promethearchaeota archaeon]